MFRPPSTSETYWRETPDGSSGLCLGLPPAQLAQRTKAEAYRTQVVATVPNIHAPTICDGGGMSTIVDSAGGETYLA